ncbi:MAG: hypothetical protein CMM07_28820 [Rhodopirellula sp.]|nr:hypothetical protein [Rhodopirellula sp.]
MRLFSQLLERYFVSEVSSPNSAIKRTASPHGDLHQHYTHCSAQVTVPLTQMLGNPRPKRAQNDARTLQQPVGFTKHAQQIVCLRKSAAVDLKTAQTCSPHSVLVRSRQVTAHLATRNFGNQRAATLVLMLRFFLLPAKSFVAM